MMLVRTYVAPSAIGGLGVFAAERIAAGTRIWAFQDGLDVIVPDDAYERLPQVAREFLDVYVFKSPFFPGGCVLSFDNSRYINHSATPNTDNRSEFTYARRDIAQDEEITCDYNELCAGFVSVTASELAAEPSRFTRREPGKG